MNNLFLCGALYKHNVFAIYSFELKSRNTNATDSTLKMWPLELLSHLKCPASYPLLLNNDFRIRP